MTVGLTLDDLTAVELTLDELAVGLVVDELTLVELTVDELLDGLLDELLDELFDDLPELPVGWLAFKGFFAGAPLPEFVAIALFELSGAAAAPFPVPISGGGGVLVARVEAAGLGFSVPFGVLPIEEGSALLLGNAGLLLFSATGAAGVSTTVGLGPFSPGAALLLAVSLGIELLAVAALIAAALGVDTLLAPLSAAVAEFEEALFEGGFALLAATSRLPAVPLVVAAFIDAALGVATFSAPALLAVAELFAAVGVLVTGVAAFVAGAEVALAGAALGVAGVALGAAEFFASVAAGVAPPSGSFGIGFAEFDPLITIDATVSRFTTAYP